MNKILVALIVAVLAAGPAAASEKTDVMGTIQRFIDAFNKGDMKSATALCAEQTSIIDDFAPHEWHGVGACSRWGKGYEAADDVAAIVAAGIIAWNGWQLLRPALDELMDTAPRPAVIEEIRTVAAGVEGVIVAQELDDLDDPGRIHGDRELIERDRVSTRSARKRANDRLPQGVELAVVHYLKP